eukprot:1157317-Pelagomonas_calceolata.AAC.3
MYDGCMKWLSDGTHGKADSGPVQHAAEAAYWSVFMVIRAQPITFEPPMIAPVESEKPVLQAQAV